MSIKKPKQSRSLVTVESILEASRLIIKKSGLEKFNTNYVAEVAGVSVGSLYQYFKNKESIIELLLHKELEKNRDALNKLITEEQNNSLEDVISKIVDYFIDNWEDKGLFGKILFQFVPEIIDFSIFKSVDKVLIPFIKEKIALSKQELKQEDLDYALFLIIQSVRTTVFLMHTHYAELDRTKIKYELKAMITHYLKNR